MWDFRIRKWRGVWQLINKTRDGRTQKFEDLVFHGGAGLILEMRLFSEKGLRKEFLVAGFEEPNIHGDPVEEFGLPWAHSGHLPMPLLRPSAIVAAAVRLAL